MRELDAEVAGKVMGFPIFSDDEYRDKYPCLTWHEGGEYHPGRHIFWADDNVDGVDWSPSEDIAAAWLVVEKMKHKYITMIYESGMKNQVSRWDCTFGTVTVEDEPTAPLAICKAALEACKKAGET